MNIRTEKEKLIIKKREGIMWLNIDEILYVERCGHQSIINTNEEEITINCTLKDILSHLPPHFTKSHRSFIINRNLLKELITLNDKTYEAIFSNEKIALVSKKNINMYL